MPWKKSPRASRAIRRKVSPDAPVPIMDPNVWSSSAPWRGLKRLRHHVDLHLGPRQLRHHVRRHLEGYAPVAAQVGALILPYLFHDLGEARGLVVQVQVTFG